MYCINKVREQAFDHREFKMLSKEETNRHRELLAVRGKDAGTVL
jgi:hypothetical protein